MTLCAADGASLLQLEPAPADSSGPASATPAAMHPAATAESAMVMSRCMATSDHARVRRHEELPGTVEGDGRSPTISGDGPDARLGYLQFPTHPLVDRARVAHHAGLERR